MENKPTEALDVKILQSLISFGKIHTVRAVIYPDLPTHEEAIEKAQQWLWDNYEVVNGEYQPK